MNKHWCRGGVNGFTIQYATNPDFSGDCKSVTSRLKENRKNIFDSPANTYYMRVRAFKHIGVTGGIRRHCRRQRRSSSPISGFHSAAMVSTGHAPPSALGGGYALAVSDMRINWEEAPPGIPPSAAPNARVNFSGKCHGPELFRARPRPRDKHESGGGNAL